ncbi:C13 family peptidase [Sphingomonas soli]|uniref:C13 family peptidase n=1 Tax=Sphingomonas soli TaxID=266127 RepID=UPI000835A00E|nr:C13 family peptidase [Sphingomonas soli]
MRSLFALLAASLLALPATAQVAPADKSAKWPGIVTGYGPVEGFPAGPELQRGRTAKWMLEDSRRMSKALAALAPQRKGVVDAYVISVGLDSDPVFGREAREAGKVLARRYDAAGRTLVLAGSDGSGASNLPNGSLTSLTLGLARVAELMDKNQDVLVLYTTSHGAKVGIAYHDGNNGYGILAPERLAALLDELGIKNRVLILSACYSGIFVPALQSDTTALFTAASSDRPSFGCRAENDWTFFGDAMINRALRKPLPLDNASAEARALIDEWEGGASLPPSNPQVSIGGKVSTWLTPLEARMPKLATQPVGAPATDALKGG